MVPTSTQAWGISRCDGSYEELVAYRSGSDEPGWHVVAPPRIGDLLVGTVGQGATRIIVNVNRVEASLNATSCGPMQRMCRLRLPSDGALWRRALGGSAAPGVVSRAMTPQSSFARWWLRCSHQWTRPSQRAQGDSPNAGTDPRRTGCASSIMPEVRARAAGRTTASGSAPGVTEHWRCTT